MHFPGKAIIHSLQYSDDLLVGWPKNSQVLYLTCLLPHLRFRQALVEPPTFITMVSQATNASGMMMMRKRKSQISGSGASFSITFHK